MASKTPMIGIIWPTALTDALGRYRKLWLAPMVGCTLLAAACALVRPATWEASQALVVRDDAGGHAVRPGRFGHLDEMKTAQETILELVRSRGVLAPALADVGPPRGARRTAGFPGGADVETLQSRIKLIPPKGAEFGKTEVFYLKVEDSDRSRAVALAGAVCRQLQGRFEELRLEKARSVSTELIKSVSLAQADLDASTAELSKVERQVGGDLAELRTLNEFPTGESSLRRSVTEIEAELRRERAAHQSNAELLKLLSSARHNPGELLASPSRLLESQPALRRLKDGLVDAQLATAKLLGNMSPSHPQVLSAEAAQREVGEHLHRELELAVRGLEMELKLSAGRVADLQRQHAAMQERLAKLAAVRAQYANLVAATRHRTDILKSAETELADARASQAAAHRASLITPLDNATAGTQPIGPSRAIIVLAGALGGLMAGLALVFLAASPELPRRVSSDKTAGPSGAARRTSNGATSIKGALFRLSDSPNRRN